MIIKLVGCLSVLIAAAGLGYAADKPIPVKVGDVAPGFELMNQRGEKVSLAQFKGKKSIVLAFSRAHW